MNGLAESDGRASGSPAIRPGVDYSFVVTDGADGQPAVIEKRDGYFYRALNGDQVLALAEALRVLASGAWPPQIVHDF